MIITLKNIKYFPSMSEETNCFQADIYINGKKSGYAENQGHGGNTSYHANEGCRDIIKQAEEYCKTLPAHKASFGDIEIDLEFFIDLLLDDHIKEKETKKVAKQLEKDSKKGICFGENGYSYRIFYWKNYTLEQMINTPVGKMQIQQAIAKIKKEGGNILNTNIPKELL